MRILLAGLLVVAILSALLWRAEIELRWGWTSLSWIADNFYSAPAICLLFSIWLYFVPCSRPNEKIPRSVLAFAGGLLGYLIYQNSFGAIYGTVGLGLFLPFWVAAASLVFLVVPLAICAVAYWFTPYFQRRYFILTPLLFAAAFPIAIFLLWITDHRGGPNTIHAIKSGFVFPFLLIAAGLPFLGGRPKETDTPQSETASPWRERIPTAPSATPHTSDPSGSRHPAADTHGPLAAPCAAD